MNEKIDETVGFEPNHGLEDCLTGNVFPLQWNLEFGRELGRGGMGVVYEAYTRDVSGVKVRIAAKVSNRHSASLAALRKETAILSKLDSDYLVKFLGYTELNGRGVILMRYVDGPDLRALMKKHEELGLRIHQKFIGSIGWLDCEGLEVAHGVGAIHRDIKPENILVDLESGDPLLADYGIGVLRSDTPQIIGQMGGTVGYIAPELIEGRQIDHRVDIYGLGMTLDAALRGRNALLDSVPEGSSPVQAIAIVRQALAQGYVPLVGIPGVNPELAQIIRTATMIDPEERFQSSAEMREQINNYLYVNKGFGPTRPGFVRYLRVIYNPLFPAYLDSLRKNGRAPNTLEFQEVRKKIADLKGKMKDYSWDEKGRLCFETNETESGRIAIEE